MADKQKEPCDRLDELEIKAAPELQKGGVIGDNGSQARWLRAQQVHYLDQNQSATDIFRKPGEAPISSSKFGIEGLDEPGKPSQPQRNANGTPYNVHTQEASQAIERVGPIHQILTEGNYQSSAKLNVQVTNVPEVTRSATPHEALKYTSTVLEAGAQVVRQTEEHLAKPNAINNDLIDMAVAGYRLPGHFSLSANQFNSDVHSLAVGAMQKVDEVFEQIGKPIAPDQRAEMAGTLLPFFLFEGGKEIDPKAANAMGLERMSDQELKALCIEKRVTTAKEAIGEVPRLAYEAPSKLVADRVAEIADAIPQNARGRITIAIAVVEHSDGARSVLLGTSEKYGYLRGVERKAGELAVAGMKQHAELDLITYAQERGLKVVDIGATRPICDHCVSKIAATGAHISTSMKVGK